MGEAPIHHVAFHVFHNHDGVVDHHPDGEHDPNSVERLTENPRASMPAEGADQGDEMIATVQIIVERKLCRKR